MNVYFHAERADHYEELIRESRTKEERKFRTGLLTYHHSQYNSMRNEQTGNSSADRVHHLVGNRGGLSVEQATEAKAKAFAAALQANKERWAAVSICHNLPAILQQGEHSELIELMSEWKQQAESNQLMVRSMIGDEAAQLIVDPKDWIETTEQEIGRSKSFV